MLNMFDILSNDERVIVLSDKEEQYVYTWNYSLTLQVFAYRPANAGAHERERGEVWDEIDIRTLGSEPANFEAARTAARLWRVSL